MGKRQEDERDSLTVSIAGHPMISSTFIHRNTYMTPTVDTCICITSIYHTHTNREKGERQKDREIYQECS